MTTPTLSADRLASFATLAQPWLFEISPDHTLTYSAGRQRPLRATLGQPFAASFLPAETTRLTAVLTHAFATGQAHTGQYWLALPHGLRAPVQLTLSAITSAQGTPTLVRGTGENLAATQQLQGRLHTLSTTDALTGLPSRAPFLAQVQRALSGRQPAALAVLDVVRFSALNQALGEDTANAALRHLAHLIRTAIRSHDVPARLDADRFAVLFTHLPEDALPARLQALQHALATHPLHTPQGPVALACTFTALPLKAGTTASAHLTHALATLAGSKVGGAGRLTLTHLPTATQAAAPLPHAWQQMVQQALAAPQQHVHLHVQPIRPLSGTAASQEFYEVLVRLSDTEGRLYPPAAWGNAVQQFGLAQALDETVTLQAMAMLKDWHARGRRLRLSVNVHPASFAHPPFVQAVTQAYQSAALPQGTLVLELTESTALPPMPQLHAALRRMQAAGIALALDDVGTGYATLNLLKDTQLTAMLSYLKIDGAFIRRLAGSPSDQALVQALVQAAKPTGMATVAEMIEDEATLTLLQTLGVTYGQGFHLSPPQATLPAIPPAAW